MSKNLKINLKKKGKEKIRIESEVKGVKQTQKDSISNLPKGSPTNQKRFFALGRSNNGKERKINLPGLL